MAGPSTPSTTSDGEGEGAGASPSGMSTEELPQQQLDEDRRRGQPNIQSNMMNEKSSNSNKNNNTRPDIIDGFERKSVELLDYVNNLEAQLEQQRSSFEHREARLRADQKALEEAAAQGEQRVRAERQGLEERLRQAQEQRGRAHKALLLEERRRLAYDHTLRSLRQDLQAAQELLHNERRRAKDLEKQIIELKDQLANNENAYNQYHIKNERERTRLEEDVALLKKKVTLGWILGCLTEVYLRLENESNEGGGGSHQDHMLGIEQRKKVGPSLNMNSSGGRYAKLESIEREVKRLIDCAQSPIALKKRQALEVESTSLSDNDLELDYGDHVASMNREREMPSSNEYSYRPCRFLRSTMCKSKHIRRHRPRSLSPTSSLVNSKVHKSYSKHHDPDHHEGSFNSACRSKRSKSQPRSRQLSHDGSSGSFSPLPHGNTSLHEEPHVDRHLAPYSTYEETSTNKSTPDGGVTTTDLHHHHHVHRAVDHHDDEGTSHRHIESSTCTTMMCTIQQQAQRHQPLHCKSSSHRGRLGPIERADIQALIATMESGLDSLTNEEKKQAVRDSIIRTFFGANDTELSQL